MIRCEFDDLERIDFGMHTLTLFNHKGGVGKTTLTINLADALTDLGFSVLLVDTDPQCNLSSFYLAEDVLDDLIGESADGNPGETLWGAIEPVVLGRGDVREINPVEISAKLHLLVGDVLLSQYEEELPNAWTESFARKPRGYDVMCAVSKVARDTAQRIDADIVMYDVGPNVGALNRTVLLDSDFFITPVHTDLYSLRALTTVGQSLARWVSDWKTVRQLASKPEQRRLLHGRPKYLGYISSAYKLYGQKKARPHEHWERMIPPRVKSRLVDVLTDVNPSLVSPAPFKIGDVPHFHSLAAVAQEYGVAVGKLRGLADSGQYPKIDELRDQFAQLAKAVTKRIGA